MSNDVQSRRFHEARWDEPVIFELSTPGERGVLPPPVDERMRSYTGDVVARIPENLRRHEDPKFPEMSQARVQRHYLRLSQQTLGADLNVDIGQGTCTMKYSPKVNEELARLPQVAELHPLQDTRTTQGMLEVMYRLDLFLRQISGLDRFSLQAGGGSQALLGIASIIRAYHESRGEEDQRTEILTTIYSHPSNAAAAAVQGFKVITLEAGPNGYPTVETVRRAVSERTAGLMITNPEDTGIFNPNIAQFTRLVHEVGGLCSYDQANANGLLGITRAREAGFDLCFFNLHKTFSSPHGCGGPAAAALGVREHLAPFLPVPVVGFDGSSYSLDFDRPQSIGKIRSFYGVPQMALRAYGWLMSLGEAGVREVAKIAVLNNNYIMKKVLELPGSSAPFMQGNYRLEQVRYSWEELAQQTGVSTEDLQRRMFDFGLHYWTSHHPWVVPEPMTIEPTESYSKAELDEFIAALEQVVHEAYTDPDKVKGAPYSSVLHKIDPEPFDDPEQWAITWRAYLRKHGR